MLTFTDTADHNHHWYVGDAKPLMFSEGNTIYVCDTVQADGVELDFIRSNFYNLPYRSSAFYVVWRGELDFGIRMGRHEFLLRHLQNIHDKVEVEKWEQSFEDLARGFSLQYTPPTPK